MGRFSYWRSAKRDYLGEPGIVASQPNDETSRALRLAGTKSNGSCDPVRVAQRVISNRGEDDHDGATASKHQRLDLLHVGNLMHLGEHLGRHRAVDFDQRDGIAA